MNLITRNRITYALSLGVLALSSSTHAQVPSLFATFAQSFPSPDFKFDSSNSGASLGLAVPLAVNFQFQTANGFGSSVGQGIPALCKHHLVCHEYKLRQLRVARERRVRGPS